MQNPQRGLIIITTFNIFFLKIKQSKLLNQLFKFYGVSIISCIVNLGSRYILNFIFSFVQSIFVSSILGGIANFVLVKKYVFHSKNRMTRELCLYGIIAIFGICFITTLSAGFEKISNVYHIIIISQDITYFVIQLLSLGVNAWVGFFLCRYIVFRDHSCENKKG